MISEPLSVTLLVTEVLESLSVTYLIGGSLASALHGVARSTLDSDLVADLRNEHVDSLIKSLDGSFYVSRDAVREAIRCCRSFNLIHFATMFKVDIFVSRQRPFDIVRFERRSEQIVSKDPVRTIFVSSAEDTILAKLEWYRLGGEISDRQWNDVLGVIKVQEHQLDWAYLHKWAIELDVADLFKKAKRKVEDE